MKRSFLLELGIVLGGGVVFALLANAISPRGLNLGRNYFPTALNASTEARQGGTAANSTGARLTAKGLALVSAEEMAELYESPLYQDELVVFVDARKDEAYRKGHIPGAYQFDYYYPEKYLETVLPACLNAERVVVYCSGANCEDSESAALFLRDAGVPNDRIFVYAGGISEWTAANRPVEIGEERGSPGLSINLE